MKASAVTGPYTVTRGRIIAYWVTTIIIALETVTGAVWDIMKIPFVRGVIEQLGYPSYILIIMGIWKVLGVVVLLAPGSPRPKEWIYAGLFFIYTGAAASHLAVGDSIHALSPAIFAGLTMASWASRPRARFQFPPWPVRGEQAGQAGNPGSSRGRVIAYWIVTALVAFQLGSGGMADILQPSSVVAGMVHLGYPVYFCVILGIWKVLGAITVLVPGFPRLKEWAYAGAFFDLTGAAASHLATGDSAVKLIGPIIFAALAVASWALRPPARRDRQIFIVH